MATVDKVVVVVTPQIGTHEESGYTIARFPELGLWAHAADREAALESLKAHFRTFIEVLRETGELEQRLEAAKVTWYPLAQAIELGIEYEDLISTPSQENSDSASPMSSQLARWSRQVDWDYGLAHAA